MSSTEKDYQAYYHLLVGCSTATAVLFYDNVLVFCFAAHSCQLFFSVLCLISGVAGQAGSPEIVWGIEDLHGELHSWRWPHGHLQRGSRRRCPALLGGRLILESQSCGNQYDLGPERNRLWTLQSGPINTIFTSKDKNSWEEKGLAWCGKANLVSRTRLRKRNDTLSLLTCHWVWKQGRIKPGVKGIVYPKVKISSVSTHNCDGDEKVGLQVK